MLKDRARVAGCALGAAIVLVVLALAWSSREPASPHVLVGRIAIAHVDGLSAAASRLQPYLDTSSGPIALHLRGGLPVVPGTRVAIEDPAFEHATIVDGNVARLAPPTTPPPTNGSKIGPANFTPGPRRVLVLLVQVKGFQAPGSADAVRSAVFTAPNSANAFIQQESFGQLSLVGRLRNDGDVSGPYPVTMAPNVCDPASWGTSAEAQYKSASGIDPETWDNVIFVFEAPTTLCPFSGEGEIGQLAPGARHVWINAVLTNGVPTTSVLAHEIGHNLGVDHAGGFNCFAGAVRISFSESCASGEMTSLADQYQDPFDVMGTGVREENAYHRWESGWLPSSAVQTALHSGTYLIAPEETASGAMQLLEVPRGSGSPSYWLDFRQPLAGWFDAFDPSDPAVNGVSIRYANASYMAHPSKSWLIDTTPETSTFLDAPLTTGRTYSEQSVSITTLSASPLGVLVKVAVAGPADTTPPGPPPSVAAAIVDGGLRLAWDPASDDSNIVQRYIVTRDGAPLADVYDTSALDSAPVIGTTSYDVRAVDPSGNEGPASRLRVTLADATAPTAPAGLAASVSGSAVVVSWSASSDNVGVASYEVDRDGQALVVGLHAVAFADAGAVPGTHTYSVRATDGAGNVGTFASVTVVVVGPAQIAVVPNARRETVKAIRLRRLGKHRVLVSWAAQRGARSYEVLRSGKPPKRLATIERVQYLDGHAPTGKLRKSRYLVRAVLG